MREIPKFISDYDEQTDSYPVDDSHIERWKTDILNRIDQEWGCNKIIGYSQWNGNEYCGIPEWNPYTARCLSMRCEWCGLRWATTCVKWEGVWLNVCKPCKAQPFWRQAAMKMEPQSTWDRDPLGTFRYIMGEINRDYKHGYLSDKAYERLVKAANKCYTNGKKVYDATH